MYVCNEIINQNNKTMTIQEYHTYRNNLYDLFVNNQLIEDNDDNYSLFDVLLYESVFKFVNN